MLKIRELNPNSKEEIELVASRMRNTLIDVLGQEKAEAMYSMDWLRERVMWHLSAEKEAKVLLAEADEVVGQAIIRIEIDDKKDRFGYFSTIYVAPEFRSQGIAKKLIQRVEAWCSEKKLPYIIYNTAHDNDRLIEILRKFSYQIVTKTMDMVQLKKSLD